MNAKTVKEHIEDLKRYYDQEQIIGMVTWQDEDIINAVKNYYDDDKEKLEKILDDRVRIFDLACEKSGDQQIMEDIISELKL